MVVLTFLDYYLPGHKAGGPIRSIANAVAALHSEFEFRIVTRDRDLGDTSPYADIVANQWCRRGPSEVFYASQRRLGFTGLRHLLRDATYDAVYLNSFFSRITMRVLLLRRFGLVPDRPVVLAPRGEFSPGAIEINGRRKRLYLALVRRLGLARRVHWQASSALEAEHILGAVGGSCGASPDVVLAREFVASSGAHDDRVGRARKVTGRATLVFLSRISPKKNLLGALRLLAGVQVPVTFLIYGPAEDSGYWEVCQAAMAQLPAHVHVEYRGAVTHDDVPRVLAEADLFFLPTLGENFGHVIIEAMAAGCPVLISTETPWRDLADAGVGWDIPLERDAEFRSAIEAIARLDDAQHAELRASAVSYAAAVAGDQSIVDENRRLFQSVSAPPSRGPNSASLGDEIERSR